MIDVWAGNPWEIGTRVRRFGDLGEIMGFEMVKMRSGLKIMEPCEEGAMVVNCILL